MADDKKPAGDKPAPSSSDPFVEIVWILMAIYIAITAINSITSFITQRGYADNGWRSLSPKSIILSSTDSISSIENPLGTKFVVASRNANVYNTPGGSRITTKQVGDKGEIVGGPVTIGDERYWEVEFDDGTSGWVKESDITSIENRELGWPIKVLIFFWKGLSLLKFLVVLISICLVFFIVYLYRGIVRTRKAESEKLYPGPIAQSSVLSQNTNPRWEKITSEISSTNPNDWKNAIMEADIMLDDLLKAMRIPGESMGDRLKNVEKSDFLTVDLAWEAHKFRNNIAHEGSNFLINDREAKRVVDLYKQVFEEFHII